MQSTQIEVCGFSGLFTVSEVPEVWMSEVFPFSENSIEHYLVQTNKKMKKVF